MKDLTAASFVCLMLFPAPVGAGKKDVPVPPPLSLRAHERLARPSRFRTPAGWLVEAGTGQPEVTEARGDGLVVRILRREGELGLDSLHVECMLVRLAAAMDTFPQVDYEYDFVGGAVGERRTLDSAFVVHYDEPIAGPSRLAAEELDRGRGGGVGLRHRLRTPARLEEVETGTQFAHLGRWRA